MPTDAKAGTVVSIMLGCPEARSVLCPTLVACTACTRLCLLSDGSGIARHECTLPPLTIRHSRLARYVAEADYVLLAVWVGGAADGLGARRAAALRRQLVLAHALGCAGVLVICTSSPGLHRPSSAEGPGAGPGPGGEGHGPGAVGEGAGGAGGTAQWSGGEGAAGREGVPPADGASVAAPTPPSPTRLQLQALVREAGFGDGAVWWCTGEAWLRPGTLRHLRPVPVDARPPARVALTSVGGGWQGMRLGGRLWSGALKMGDMVVAAPAQRGHTTTGQLTYLYNGGQMGDGRAGAGALVDFEVANSGTARHLRKGQLLGLIKDAPPVSARAIRGRVQVVPPAPADGAAAPAGAAGGRGLRVGQSLLLCAHAARVQVRVAALAAPGPGERAPCRLEPGEAGVVVLVLARKAAMEVVADYPRLGRFVLMQVCVCVCARAHACMRACICAELGM